MQHVAFPKHVWDENATVDCGTLCLQNSSHSLQHLTKRHTNCAFPTMLRNSFFTGHGALRHTSSAGARVLSALEDEKNNMFLLSWWQEEHAARANDLHAHTHTHTHTHTHRQTFLWFYLIASNCVSFDAILSSPHVKVQQLCTNKPNEPPISKATITQSNIHHISRKLENILYLNERVHDYEVTETAVQHFSLESLIAQTLSSSQRWEGELRPGVTASFLPS